MTRGPKSESVSQSGVHSSQGDSTDNEATNKDDDIKIETEKEEDVEEELDKTNKLNLKASFRKEKESEKRRSTPITVIVEQDEGREGKEAVQVNYTGTFQSSDDPGIKASRSQDSHIMTRASRSSSYPSAASTSVGTSADESSVGRSLLTRDRSKTSSRASSKATQATVGRT